MANPIMTALIKVTNTKLDTGTVVSGSLAKYFLHPVTSTHPATASIRQLQSGPPPFGVAEETGPKNMIISDSIHKPS